MPDDTSRAYILNDMRVAIMHHHVRPGGVTTVIRDQVAVCAGNARCIVLTGELPSPGSDSALEAACRLVPGIGYARPGEPAPDPVQAALAIRRAMLEEWGAPAHVLHVHNATLGKNPFLGEILRRVQEMGIRLFVQVHDFAEDGRPSVYARAGEYPGDCRYGAINTRDRDALVHAGLDPAGVHLMWNMVSQEGGAPRRAAQRGSPPRLIYPVRAIRRKNVGEAILVATLLEARLVITLPPRNPSEMALYGRWKEFCRSAGCAVRFEAGVEKPLRTLMAEADAALTTSVKEGFGFAFLEPWAHGVPVMGRRIASTCADFEREGIRLPALYDALRVPLDHFDGGSFFARWRSAILAHFHAFGRRLDDSALDKAWDAMRNDAGIDFSFLDEQAQEEVLTRALMDREALLRMNAPAVESMFQCVRASDAALVERNRSAIGSSYGAQRYSRLLAGIYRAACGAPVSHRIDKGTLLDLFLKPERFRMIAAAP